MSKHNLEDAVNSVLIESERKLIGNAPLTTTANKLKHLLTIANIPFTFCGGYCVQQYGYPRFTSDVDIIINTENKEAAIDYLSIHGFQEIPGTKSTLKDRETKITVDILPGGGTVTPDSLDFPKAEEYGVFLPIEDLISLKLDSFRSSGIKRAKDQADVVELILRVKLPRDLDVNSSIKPMYMDLWSELHETN